MSLPVGPMPASQRNRKIFAAAGLGVFQRIVQIVSTLLVMPLVLRALGIDKFGVWGAATSLAWWSALADIGTGTALVTLVAQSVARSDPDKARNQIAGALGVGTCVGSAMLALALIAWLSGIVHGNAVPYFIALIGLAFNVPLNSANNVWMGLQKGYVSGFWELMQTVLTTAALIAATRVTANLQSYVVIVYLCLVTANLGSLLHLLWRHPELRPGLSIVKPSLMKAVASTGILFFALGATGGLAFLLDNVLALQLLGPEAAARMTIAMRICMTASAMLVVLSQPLWPAFAEAAHTGDRGWIRRGFLRGAALLVGLSVLGSIVLLLFGERFLVLWLHTNLGIGRGFLLAIGAWVLAQAVIRVPTLLLNGLSLIRFQVIVCWIATAAALVMKFAFAKTFGVSGILWGTTLAVLLMVAPAEIWRIFKWVGTPAKLEPGPDMPDEALSTLDRSLFGA